MKDILLALCLALSLAVISQGASSQDVPHLVDCSHINIRTSQGWWLSVNRDGSGAYGFGTGQARVNIKKGTFQFAGLYDETVNAATETSSDAEASYIAVSWYIAESSSAREFYLEKGEDWMAALFEKARHFQALPANSFEEAGFQQAKEFWNKSPYPAYRTPDVSSRQ